MLTVPECVVRSTSSPGTGDAKVNGKEMRSVQARMKSARRDMVSGLDRVAQWKRCKASGVRRGA